MKSKLKFFVGFEYLNQGFDFKEQFWDLKIQSFDKVSSLWWKKIEFKTKSKQFSCAALEDFSEGL